jgi:hypothetical protein
VAVYFEHADDVNDKGDEVEDSEGAPCRDLALSTMSLEFSKVCKEYLYAR